MPKYTELSNKESIFTPVRTNSSADSSAEVSEVFGKISEQFAKKAITVGEEKSNGTDLEKKLEEISLYAHGVSPSTHDVFKDNFL